MTDRLSRSRLPFAAAAATLVLVGVAGAATTSRSAPPDPQPGRWHGVATADAPAADLTFRIVHTSKGTEIRDFALGLPESCADASGQTPPVLTGTSIAAKRIRITSTGRFRFDDGESSMSGRVTRRRTIVGEASTAPGALNCSGGLGTFTAAPVKPPRTTTVSSTGRKIRLKAGEQLAVDVVENPSTGFSWRVTSQPGVLGTVSSTFIPTPTQTPMTGVPGRHVFVFSAERPGRGTLRLVRGRTPPSSDSAVEDFSVAVTVMR